MNATLAVAPRGLESSTGRVAAGRSSFRAGRERDGRGCRIDGATGHGSHQCHDLGQRWTPTPSIVPGRSGPAGAIGTAARRSGATQWRSRAQLVSGRRTGSSASGMPPPKLGAPWLWCAAALLLPLARARGAGQPPSDAHGASMRHKRALEVVSCGQDGNEDKRDDRPATSDCILRNDYEYLTKGSGYS